MKKLITIMLLPGLLLLAGFAYGINDVIIKINGAQIGFNQSSGYPFIDENNRTQVPFRQTLETYGAQVDWDSSARVAIAKKDGITVEVPIGTDYIYKDGVKL